MTFITIILLYENDFVSQSECIIGDFAMQSPLFMFGFGRALKSGSAQVKLGGVPWREVDDETVCSKTE